ncbi:MAG: zf-HC2 domain-containing protein [Planctomycetes bacterium]|nr:zf-HC2 domain-containing protein [Planctomycetota bacterium]
MNQESNSVMLDCAATMRLCHPYIDNEMSPESVAKVRAHLSGCPACGRHFTSELAFISFVRSSMQRDDGTATNALHSRIGEVLDAVDQRKAGRWGNGNPIRRLLAVAALLLVGAGMGIGATVIWQSASSDADTKRDDVMARVEQACRIATRVLPEPGVPGRYADAAKALDDAYPGVDLPQIPEQGAPSPRLFGTEHASAANLHWVVFCDGDPEMKHRFVLLTVSAPDDSQGVSTLREMSLGREGLVVLVWRDKAVLRVLITRADVRWAKEQMTALSSA